MATKVEYKSKTATKRDRSKSKGTASRRKVKVKAKGLSKGNVDMIDKLAHAAKNLGKVIECCEDEEYSNAMDGYSRRGSYRGMSYGDHGYSSDGNYVRPDGSYRREIVDSSYARGRGARRDSMGRYSSSAEDQTIQEVRMLLNRTQDEQTRKELSKLVDRLESM